jgi:hypothetical protein
MLVGSFGWKLNLGSILPFFYKSTCSTKRPILTTFIIFEMGYYSKHNLLPHY